MSVIISPLIRGKFCNQSYLPLIHEETTLSTHQLDHQGYASQLHPLVM